MLVLVFLACCTYVAFFLLAELELVAAPARDCAASRGLPTADGVPLQRLREARQCDVQVRQRGVF